jgi:hypothetical protein
LVFDGKDRPYNDPDGVCVTSSARRIDALHFTAIRKGKGPVVVLDRLALSPAHARITLTDTVQVNGRTVTAAVLVYERQP